MNNYPAPIRTSLTEPFYRCANCGSADDWIDTVHDLWFCFACETYHTVPNDLPSDN